MRKGQKMPLAAREKLILSCKGKPSPMEGKHHTVESRKKISDYRKGKHLSEEHRKKLSDFFKGRPSPTKGKKHSVETLKRMSMIKTGRRHSVETKLKISEQQRGEKNHQWNGGKSFGKYCKKFNNNFKERVRAYFGYYCQLCGTPQNGTKLAVHHINYDKMVCCNEIQPLFVPLCKSCNTKVNANRDYWEQYFTEIINNYYLGKCFLTNEEYKEWITE
jgi:hypothetical protein